MVEVLGRYTKNMGGESWFLHNLVFLFQVENRLHEKSEYMEYLWHYAIDFILSPYILENNGLLNNNKYWNELDIRDQGHSKGNVSHFCLYLGYPWINFNKITSLPKKPGLDKNTPSNFRPISNLNNISKLLERLILSRIQYHTTAFCNFNPFQSAYSRYYSTESALLLALDNIYHATDKGSSTVLISLDLSAAFDTIDHTILLSRLQTSFGISGLTLAWFHSYLEGRSQFVHIGCSTSTVTLCTMSVPQGSVLGPMLFSLFISPIAYIVSSYGLLQQQYADDNQLYVAISKDNYDTPVAKLELCLSTLHTRFCYIRLALNPDKSEAIVLALPSAHILFQFPPLSMDQESLSRFPIRSEFLALYSTVDSHLMHTSLHFQNPVSITSVHSATSVLTSH